jgi:hypothetical protein
LIVLQLVKQTHNAVLDWQPAVRGGGGSGGAVTVVVSDPRIEAFEALRRQPCLVRLEGCSCIRPSDAFI